MDGTGRLSVRTARDGDRVLVEIGDNRLGIPEAAAAHTWSPLLHHQAGRQGHRPGARYLLADRRPPPRWLVAEVDGRVIGNVASPMFWCPISQRPRLRPRALIAWRVFKRAARR
jgi:hypothetical protein